MSANALYSQDIPKFQSGKIINENETIILEIIETILGDRFRYCPQVPLNKICIRPEPFTRLPDNLWKFWANSTVDFALLAKGYCENNQAKLVIECQSHWHDRPDRQKKDRLKAELLERVGVPLMYVRRIEADRRFYRFYTPDQKEEVIYNYINQEHRDRLEHFLKTWCF